MGNITKFLSETDFFCKYSCSCYPPGYNKCEQRIEVTSNNNLIPKKILKHEPPCLKALHPCIYGYCISNMIENQYHMECVSSIVGETCISRQQNFYQWASKYGYLHIIKYMHKQNISLNDSSIIYYTTINGHYECLKYVLENKCPLTEKIILKILIVDDVKYIELIFNYLDPKTFSAELKHNIFYYLVRSAYKSKVIDFLLQLDLPILSYEQTKYTYAYYKLVNPIEKQKEIKRTNSDNISYQEKYNIIIAQYRDLLLQKRQNLPTSILPELKSVIMSYINVI